MRNPRRSIYEYSTAQKKFCHTVHTKINSSTVRRSETHLKQPRLSNVLYKTQQLPFQQQAENHSMPSSVPLSKHTLQHSMRMRAEGELARTPGEGRRRLPGFASGLRPRQSRPGRGGCSLSSRRRPLSSRRHVRASRLPLARSGQNIQPSFLSSYL